MKPYHPRWMSIDLQGDGCASFVLSLTFYNGTSSCCKIVKNCNESHEVICCN